MLIDPFKRKISYVRVSVTDRCDFRCTYCMSEDMEFLPKKDVLSLEELDRLCNTFIDLGVKKLRITGGEPLVRKNIMQLFSNLGKKLGQGLEELTLTTNGSQLDRYAKDLFENGVRRINVSLDSLEKNKFKKITRIGDLDKVINGIMVAKKAGLKIKINAVALKGINDNEILNDVWYGVVINVNNKYSKLTANVFKLEPGSNLLNSNTTQTGITSVLNDSKDISAYDWNSLKQWSLMPGPAKLTNVRLFNRSIEAEQRLNVLQQYIVRDNKFALVIDNAVPSIQLRRYNQNR